MKKTFEGFGARLFISARATFNNLIDATHDDLGARLFVFHHLKELDSSYWQKHLSTATPGWRRVLEMLVLDSHWGGDDELDIFDFTLPDGATNYVVSVSFDALGNVCGITMEG